MRGTMNESFYPHTFIQANLPIWMHKSDLPTMADLEKRNTEEYGVGIFAQRLFRRGEMIGNFIAEPSHDVLQHSLQRTPNEQLHDPHFIGYLLHSCDPNVVLDMHQQAVYCVRDIQQNEPLFMDYATTEDRLFRQFACGCCSLNCRRWITGRHELVNQEGFDFLKALEDAKTDVLIESNVHAIAREQAS